jgi:hypothetical protein
MDNTKFIQKSAKTSLNQTSKRMCLDFTAVLSITAIILMVVALISSSIASEVDAKPRSTGSPDDICIIAENHGCYCSNDTVNLTAECCATTNTGNTNCETCDIDTKTGDYVNCVINSGLTRCVSNLPGAPHHGAYLGSQPQNPGNVMTFNPPNNAKTFVNSNNSSK